MVNATKSVLDITFFTECQLFMLKGHCHAIWHLYKKLEGVFASTESQT